MFACRKGEWFYCTCACISNLHWYNYRIAGNFWGFQFLQIAWLYDVHVYNGIITCQRKFNLRNGKGCLCDNHNLQCIWMWFLQHLTLCSTRRRESDYPSTETLLETTLDLQKILHLEHSLVSMCTCIYAFTLHHALPLQIEISHRAWCKAVCDITNNCECRDHNSVDFNTFKPPQQQTRTPLFDNWTQT